MTSSQYSSASLSKPKPNSVLMQTYFLYSAILALKLLVFAPLAHLVCNPDKIQRANISELKNLTPFWLVSGLYMTTSPDYNLAVNLLRAFAVARLVAALGYVRKVPRMAREAAFIVSFGITSFMAGCVVYKYRSAL